MGGPSRPDAVRGNSIRNGKQGIIARVAPKVSGTPVGRAGGREVTRLWSTLRSIHRCPWSGETEPSDVVVKWIRSKVSKRAEPAGQNCISCLRHIAGTTEDELFFAGGVFLPGVGWFCSSGCERQYRVRFRVQASKKPAAGPAGAPVSRSPAGKAPTPPPENPPEPAAPARRSAADELADALRARRRG